MYSLTGYTRMIDDRVRTDAYLAALERAVTPGAVVVEIGTGTGFFAVMAARLGAKRVFAIEPDPAIEAAREVAREAGVSDRIEFIQALSTAVTLPEPADVLLSDLRGVLPAFGHHIPSIADARSRLLALGGVQIPQSDTLRMALLESEDAFHCDLGHHDPAPHGVSFEPVRRRLANSWRKRAVTGAELLSDGVEWARIDYRTVIGTRVTGTARLTALRDGVAHGICAWFDATLLPGIGFSNHPAERASVYGQAYYPFPCAVPVGAGEVVEVSLDGQLVGDEYAWRWRAHTPAKGWRCDQTTFRGAPLDARRLERRSGRFVPGATRRAALDGWILQRMDGSRDNQRLALEAAAAFPDLLPTEDVALAYVADLAERYGA